MHEGSVFNISYLGDSKGLVYFVVAKKGYKDSIVFAGIEELTAKFLEKIGADAATTSRKDGLDSKARDLLASSARGDNPFEGRCVCLCCSHLCTTCTTHGRGP